MFLNTPVRSKASRPKILIVGPAWVGDMVMAHTLFQLLAARDPQPIIDVLAPPWTRPLLARMPEINRSISLPIAHGELALKTRYKLGRRLVREQYDEAIVLPNSFKSALIPLWAKIPVRRGWRGECRFGLLNTHRKLDKQAYPKMIERFAALAFHWGLKLPRLPYPVLTVSPEQQSHALVRLALSAPTQPMVALCPGAEFGPSKRWPEHYFATVANAMLERGYAVWLFGSPKDKVVADQIQQATGGACVNLCGETNLAEAIDLLALADKVVSNDSGLMHIASALGKPLVALYGSTDPGFTPPLNHDVTIIQADTPCSPCFKRTCPLGHHECMNSLSPERVIDALVQEVVAA